MNIRLEKEISYFENLKQQALDDRNGINYYNCCERLGLQPEDKLLYEQGLTDKLNMGEISL